MPHQKRFALLVLAAAVLVALVSPARAQDADADRAKALLSQGLSQFKALNFRAAKATFLKVDRDSLQDADRQTLEEHLNKVDTAIRLQAAAAEALRAAEKALRANDLPNAQKGFATAAASEHLPPQTRQDAEAQLALVNKKMEVAAAAAAAKAAAEKAAAKAAADKAAAEKAAAGKAAAGKAAADKAAAEKAAAEKAAAEKAAAGKAAAEKAAAEKAAAEKAAAERAGAEKAAAERAAAEKAAAEKAAAAKAAAEKTAAEKAAAEKAGAERAAAKAAARSATTDKAATDRAKALDLLKAGNQALDDRQTAVAVLYFQRALALAPDLGEARKQLDYARGLLGTTSEPGPLGRLDRLNRIRLQEANVVFKKHLTQSHEILTTAKREVDLKEARSAVDLAAKVLDINKSLYARGDYSANRTLVESQYKFIALKLEAWQRKHAEQQRVALRTAEAQRARREFEQRREKIAILSARARSLVGENKYAEARDEFERIIVLDPDNIWAIQQKEMLDQFVVLLEERWIHKTLLDEEKKSLLAVRDAQIPWYNELIYPPDWKELSIRRLARTGGLYTESEADRAARAKLRTRLQRLDFDDIELKDVIQFLRDVAGVNIYVKWQSLSAAGVERATTVNIHLGSVTVEKALQLILDDVGGVNPLGFIIEDGVVMVTSREDLQTRTITRVYDIRDMIFRVPNFKGPRMDLEMNAGQGQQQGGGGGGADMFQDTGTEEDTMSKAELVAKIVDAIKTTVDPPSWTDETRVGIRELHGQLIVTQTAENHRGVLELISKLREARTLTVNIEARFVTVTTAFLNRVGLNLDFYFNLGSRFGTGTTTITDPWTDTDITVSGAGRGSSWDSVTPIAATSGGRDFISGTQSLATGVADNIGDLGALTGLGVPSALALTGAFLDDIQVDFVLEATQAQSTHRTVNAPRITLFNGQRAYIVVATVRQYIANYEPVVGENASAMAPRIGYVPTGTVLDVEATVSADRRYVTLTIRPQVARLINLNSMTMTVTNPWGGGSSTALVQLPEVQMEDLSTTVSVPDGGTMLLGGQRLAGERELEIGVPILNKIPIVNRAFTNRGKARDAETLLILVKAKIIIHREEEERAFPGLDLSGM